LSISKILSLGIKDDRLNDIIHTNNNFSLIKPSGYFFTISIEIRTENIVN